MPGGSGPGFKSRGAMEVPWAVLAFSTPPIRTFCWRGKTTFHLSAHTVRRRRRWQSIFWGANFNNRNAYGLVRKWMLLLLGPDRRWDHGLVKATILELMHVGNLCFPSRSRLGLDNWRDLHPSDGCHPTLHFLVLRLSGAPTTYLHRELVCSSTIITTNITPT